MPRGLKHTTNIIYTACFGSGTALSNVQIHSADCGGSNGLLLSFGNWRSRARVYVVCVYGSVFVCMYVCVFVCVYLCVCMYVCVCVWEPKERMSSNDGHLSNPTRE